MKNLVLLLCLALCAATVYARQAADSIAVQPVNTGLASGDTATLLVEKEILQDLSQEQKNAVMMILRYGTTDFYKKDPFMLSSDRDAIIRPAESPYRNNIDQLLKSMEANLKEYYEKSHDANKAGEILNYLSFLLIFL
jgi:phage-related tail protein